MFFQFGLIFIISLILLFEGQLNGAPASPTESYCQEITIRMKNGIDIVWPKTQNDEYAVSTPRCKTEKGELIKQKCANGSWEKNDAKCVFYTLNSENCPDEYEVVQKDKDSIFCAKINDNVEASFKCPHTNIEFMVYKPNSPIAKYHKKKLPNRHAWIEQEYRDNEEYHASNCSAWNINEMKIFYQNCRNRMPKVCIHKINLEWRWWLRHISFIKQACPDGMYWNAHSQYHNQCFGIEERSPNENYFPEANEKNLFQPVTFEDIFSFRRLAEHLKMTKDSSCLVNLKKLKIPGYNVHNSFGTIDINGEISLNQNYTCIVKTSDLPVQTPEMKLKCGKESKKVRLIIYSIEYIFEHRIRCYLNSKSISKNHYQMNEIQGDDFSANVHRNRTASNQLRSRTIYSFSFPINIIDTPEKSGRFYCDGISIHPWERINTNLIMVEYDEINKNFVCNSNVDDVSMRDIGNDEKEYDGYKEKSSETFDSINASVRLQAKVLSTTKLRETETAKNVKKIIEIADSLRIESKLINNETSPKQVEQMTIALNSILNMVMIAPEKVITEVAKEEKNSTNIILNSHEIVIEQYATLDDIYDENGIHMTRTPRLIQCLINPATKNISGLALYSNSSLKNEITFSNYWLRYITLNETLDDVLVGNYTNWRLEAATFLPEDVFERLGGGTNPKIRLVINVFFNDNLFWSNDNVHATKVISVSVPGLQSILPGTIPIIINVLKPCNRIPKNPCKFWSFVANKSSAKGFGAWSTAGCKRTKTTQNGENLLSVCECDHLTNFAFLLSGKNNNCVDTILETISVILSSLSLVGLCFIIITFLVFREWRTNRNKQLLVHFSIALGLQLIWLVIVDSTKDKESHSVLCLMFGGLLQFFTLATFTWMLIFAIRQYRLFVKVFANEVSSKFYRNSVLFAWGLPLLITILTVAFYRDSFKLHEDQFCYPKDKALDYGVIMPILTILMTNSIIFILVVKNIYTKTNIATTMHSTYMPQLKLTFLMFFCLGFTWLFGLAASLMDGPSKTIFVYLFSITTPLQGLILFTFNIALNKGTRLLWLSKTNPNRYRQLKLNVSYKSVAE